MDPSTAEAKHLLAFIERIERLESDKQEVAADIKEVYAEAKGIGYCTKTIRKIVAIRKQDKDKRREEEELLEVYMSALGMLADTPLGEAAIARDLGRRPVNPTAAMREQREAEAAVEQKRREEQLAADVERRRVEAEKAEERRKAREDALRAAYIEDARKAGFDAYDEDPFVEPQKYAGDVEALTAYREAWEAAKTEAAKFKTHRKRGGSQPSAGAAA